VDITSLERDAATKDGSRQMGRPEGSPDQSSLINSVAGVSISRGVSDEHDVVGEFVREYKETAELRKKASLIENALKNRTWSKKDLAEKVVEMEEEINSLTRFLSRTVYRESPSFFYSLRGIFRDQAP